MLSKQKILQSMMIWTIFPRPRPRPISYRLDLLPIFCLLEMIRNFLFFLLFLVSKVYLFGVEQRRIGRLETVSWEDYFALGSNQLQFGSGADYPDLSVVGALVSSSNSLGTATLIAPNILITAAHIIKNSYHDQPDPYEWTFYLGDELSLASNDSYSVKEFIIHEGWTNRQSVNNPLGDGDFLGVDLAMVVLNEDVVGHFPARLPNLQDNPLYKKAVIAGYGTLVEGNNGSANSLNKKRVGAENTIDRSVSTYLDNKLFGGLLGIDFDSPFSNSNSLASGKVVDNLGNGTSNSSPLELEGSTAQGDSGGPAFVYTEKTWRLHGLVSYGTEDSTYGDVTVYTRLASHYHWIHERLPHWHSSKAVGEGGWLENPWLGPLYPYLNNWNFFPGYGWMFVPSAVGEKLWAWNHLMNDWIWFSFSALPYVYSHSEENWIYILDSASNANSIKAYSYAQKKWVLF